MDRVLDHRHERPVVELEVVVRGAGHDLDDHAERAPSVLDDGKPTSWNA